MSDVNTVTFEKGYERLQAIAERVNSEEVPVDELCDLFAEGKGLEKALSDYLAEQKARVEKIERGEGVQSFRVEAPSNGSATTEGSPPAVAAEMPAAEQAAAGANGARKAAAGAGGARKAAPGANGSKSKKAQPETEKAQPQALGQ